ncbi:MAG: PAS domain-containing protein [Deferribacteres bacterium]|nr:PAS domain-containing protein [candidate division KSB1 bacterium]MCB9500704.1 PAS domain-containing protein [Deferribacteres bacterium]
MHKSPQKRINEKILFSGQSRFIIVIFVLIAALMISSAVIELQQSKKELAELMTKQAHSLLESLIIASQNTLHASTYLDEISKDRLINNASLIKILYENDQLTNSMLDQISRQNNIYRINIFNRNGKKLFTSHPQQHTNLPEKHSPKDILAPIFSGEADTLIIGYKEARYETGYRFAVALSARNGTVIVLNVDADEMLKFKRAIDFGALIRKVVEANPQIEYIALQSTEHILAAAGNVVELDGVEQSDFLTAAYQDSVFSTRFASFESGKVFEAVHPFSYENEIIGLFRLGLSLSPMADINERIYRRLLVITLILIIVGFVLFVYLFTRHRYDTLQKQYEVVETYSGNIIDNASDAIIVYDREQGIKIFNGAAEKMFLIGRTEVLGKDLRSLFVEPDCQTLLDEDSFLQQINCKIGDRNRDLLASKNSFSDRDKIENTILLLRDLTEQKQLQAQLERQQRLTAMGELASGVAHEIRNPLNAIGAIVQQLDKDFEPVESKEEYHELAGVVYNEVKRINKTVQDFLRFSRPEALHLLSFPLGDFFQDLEKQYSQLLVQHQISLSIQMDWRGVVYWDKNQMKQVFINLIQNAQDAIGEKGTIAIDIKSTAFDEIMVRIEDSGGGIPEKILSNIFNLYFTTKAKGTGIGLSIVQRIIFEHGGIISVDSEQGKGTVFTIKLPIRTQEKAS